MKNQLISEPNYITSPTIHQRTPFILEKTNQLNYHSPRLNTQEITQPNFHNRTIKNRHIQCEGEVYDKRDLCNASNDNQLLKPETVRGNNRLKSKPAVTRFMKKEIIANFLQNKQQFYDVTPMKPIYDLFQQRYEQKNRDRSFQKTHFQKLYKHHLSKAIQYTVQQVTNYLSFDDVFKVKLETIDFDRYLKRQPKLLRASVSSNDLQQLQGKEVDNELATNRKIQLIENVFKDPHFNAKEREVLYQVLIFQIGQAQKQAAKLEKASLGIKGLHRFQTKKEGHLEQLATVLDFMQANYDKLVKLI